MEAALTYIEEARRNDGPDSDEIYDDLMGHYQQKLFALTRAGEEEPIGYRPEDHKQYFRISRQVLSEERAALARLRDQGRISDAVLRDTGI